MARVAYVDIETSPNIADVWGLWDQNVGLTQLRQSSRIIGVGYKWRGQKRAKWIAEYNPETGALSEQLPMLQAIHQLYDEADIIVTYNGDKFDHKHLNAAWISAGLTPPSPIISVDLCKVVKKQFKFPSNKLAYVADRLIGDTKVENGGHLLWRQCLDPDVDPQVRKRAWQTMSRYCRQDVDLLEPLHDKLTPWLSNGANIALINGSDAELACVKCGGEDLIRKGFAYTTTRRYQRYKCRGCGGWNRGKAFVEGGAARAC